ncbi:MAG: DUF47 domain-containing protein [Bacteroidota bacterium]|jgi:predicted phosphate transport protein (TIGR00153 family)|nr:DUF47 family protein [Ignavibacteria bacterium]HEX2964129.1 DUF47 family protein [Ignavibacteriales bacterium]MCU7498518.1 DUF47 family protein [Ignavibacteria bacterium]MCU7513532.1 DUF47 family protein [Ignavibacteria bacterium]MCU7521905.1 DUF47 family protein [Ignavibacteria bacterium]
MFKALLPKEEKYFEDFSAMIIAISEMATLAKNFFGNANYDEETSLKLKALEKRCDEISHKVFNKLDKSFLTPFDREDIYALIKTLEKVSDAINAAVTRAKVYNLTEPLKVAEKLLQIASMQIKELYTSIVDRKVKSNDNLKIVKDLEQEADLIYREAITKLFKEESNAIELIKRKEVLDVLEDITDKCQAVASVIFTISLKNG